MYVAPELLLRSLQASLRRCWAMTPRKHRQRRASVRRQAAGGPHQGGALVVRQARLPVTSEGAATCLPRTPRGDEIATARRVRKARRQSPQAEGPLASLLGGLETLAARLVADANVAAPDRGSSHCDSGREADDRRLAIAGVRGCHPRTRDHPDALRALSAGALRRTGHEAGHLPPAGRFQGDVLLTSRAGR